VGVLSPPSWFPEGPSKWLQLESGFVRFSPYRPFKCQALGRCFELSAGLSLTSLRMPLPSIAAPGVALLRLASRLRQVRPGPSPLWPVAPPWVKFCILTIGLMPRLTSGFITPSEVRCFSFFGYRQLNFLACTTGHTLALAVQLSSQQAGSGPH
jgi:hypothetical protein